MRRARIIVLFLAPLLVVVLLAQAVLCRLYNARARQKFTTILNHRNDPEVMIFGSSVAYHEFDPRIMKSALGMDAYNMGWDGLFFVQYQGLIREFLSYEKRCRYIVIGTDFENFGKNALITRPDLFMAYINNDNIYEALREIQPDEVVRARYIPGYLLTMMNKSFYCDILFPGNIPDTLLGYDPVDMGFQQKDAPDWTARFDDNIYNELKSCLAQITGRGIKVVLVMTPVVDEGYKTILNAAEIKDKYQSLTNKDVFFLDYTTDSLCHSKAYFTNFSHLNRTGSTIFMQHFCADMQRIMAR